MDGRNAVLVTQRATEFFLIRNPLSFSFSSFKEYEAYPLSLSTQDSLSTRKIVVFYFWFCFFVFCVSCWNKEKVKKQRIFNAAKLSTI